MRARRTRCAPRTSQTNATDAWLRKREGKRRLAGPRACVGGCFASGDATGDTPHSRENGHRAGLNRRSIAPRPSGYPRRNYTIACGERELLIAPKVVAHIGLADRRHCEANTLPLSYTPKSTLSRHLETQGFEPWTFCNVVCAAAATPACRDAPEVGLEPTTTRLRVLRSAD